MPKISEKRLTDIMNEASALREKLGEQKNPAQLHHAFYEVAGLLNKANHNFIVNKTLMSQTGAWIGDECGQKPDYDKSMFIWRDMRFWDGKYGGKKRHMTPPAFQEFLVSVCGHIVRNAEDILDGYAPTDYGQSQEWPYAHLDKDAA